jgi:hypothetical protein
VASKTDSPIKQDVEEELRLEPMIDTSQMGVTVDAGIVVRTDVIDTLREKWLAQAAPAAVTDVREVIQGLVLKVLANPSRNDAQSEAAAKRALKWAEILPHAVTAKLAQGWLTPDGQVACSYERYAAARAVGHITGIVSTSDAIVVRALGVRAIRSGSKA